MQKSRGQKLAVLGAETPDSPVLSLSTLSLLRLGAKLGYGPLGLRALFWFQAVSGEDSGASGWIQVPHAVLSEDLGVDRRRARAALKDLLGAGIIVQAAPRQTVYRIEPGLRAAVMTDYDWSQNIARGSSLFGPPEELAMYPKAATREKIRKALASVKE
jgi:hypothetical protein